METPRLTELHDAVSQVNGCINDDEGHAAMAVIEDHNRELFATLDNLVRTGSINNPSPAAITSLTDLGLISPSYDHTTHLSMLTQLISDSLQPTNPPTFYNEFNELLPRILAHDHAATVLAATVQLFLRGLITRQGLIDSYAQYTENTKGLTNAS